MSVAIHPSETRPNAGPPRAVGARPRLRLAAGIVLGGAALAGFTAGAFSFFSGLADPRVRPVPVAPVASQWPDLKDGVPALAEGPTPAPTRLSLPPTEPPPQRAEAAPAAPAPAVPPAQAAAKAEPFRAEIAKPAVAKPAVAKIEASEQKAEPVRAAVSGRPNLPIEPATTLAPARTAAPVTPAKVAATLAPARAETVRAKAEQPARFVSLPGKAEALKPEAPKPESPKAEAKATPRPEKAEAARKPTARTRVTTAEATPAAPSPAPAPAPAAAAADDEPELLGMKIPGGRQLRDGWNATVGGLMGKKDGE
ncbi:hypothetical protein HNR00_004479 [Methylorubrum rhodinum]|uniref:Uncharacterized protein n=1 Tax=Methylorubrum rhodinum TaxID=29428 RepID=A0A840ZRT9_9HYPH|nr:hypothetical protein [Methylorubrum rhodinum]MBB5759745.1 hypothetical protein [Methylorubrum rhodinum]